MISKEFQECIDAGDITIIRSALLDDLIIDRTFKKFDENLEAAKNKWENILVPYDGKPFESNPEKWDRDYLNKQTVALMVNFSQKRIDHLKDVIPKVMPPKAHEKKVTKLDDQKFSKQSEGLTGSRVLSEKEKQTRRIESKNNNGNTLIISGTITAGVGIAIAQPFLVGVGFVIAGAGVGEKLSNKR